ncbi:uncharacterized protein [Diabrotica undecimpunctata]|uniref:uncharacterized protein n=1 Tax=Diabrotica undecimpunctata TaxID=50387 RepID=UPI003B63F232
MSDPIIVQLRKKRGIIKSKLTNFQKFLSKIQDLADIHDVSIHIVEIETRLNKFQCLLHDFELIQDDIECHDSVSDNDSEEREDFENSFYSAVALTKSILEKFNSGRASENSDHSAKLNAIENNVGSCAIKLPTIEMPKFNGDFERWMDFRDSFDSLIIKNSNLSEIQKFHYLKSSISGNAATVISSLPLSASNFQLAWQLICERYANKCILKFSHTKAIFNLPKICKENPQQLRQLLDSVLSNLRSLKSLGEPTDQWSTLLSYIVVDKLDTVTEREWDLSKTGSATFDDLIEFLKRRADILENRILKTSENKDNFQRNYSKGKFSKSFISTQVSCQFCQNAHKISNCPEFLRLSVKQRAEQVKGLKLCLNCLHTGHISKGCKYGKCHKCALKHHTLLHVDTNRSSLAPHDSSVPQGSGITSSSENQSSAVVNLAAYQPNNQVLLSTVSILVKDSRGQFQSAKAILESGSQSNFISEDFVNKLGLEREVIEMSVSGISQVPSLINSKCLVELEAVHSKFVLSLPCLIVRKLCNSLPSFPISTANLNIPQNITLADPTFNKPSRIDILIGSAVFWDLLQVGQIRLGRNMPTLQKTRFGWIISGPLSVSSGSITQCNFTCNSECQTLSKFWELEECDNTKVIHSKEEQGCEDHFISTFNRDNDGRFIVSIPLKESPNSLGESRQIAAKQFYHLERRFNSNPLLQQQYFEFMQEYIDMGHMSKCSPSSSDKVSYFLPHHPVIKEESSTTKLRVVFNGSSPSSSGVSFNNLQMVGPIIQSDLLSILLRFRQHTYVVSADIAKMYRQVLVNPEQRNLQQILWRFSPEEELSPYQLNTITYGTASASFLATRCLLQLSLESSGTNPKAAQIIRDDFYVDDLLTGSDSATDLAIASAEISDILQRGCFPLRKWVSNCSSIIQGLNASPVESNFLRIGDSTKALGILWHIDEDVLSYHVTTPVSNSASKRTILSNIAQIFDPLGLLAPCIIKAKIIIQEIWSEHLEWDQSVPVSIHTKWLIFKDQLSLLNNLKIPRHVICSNHILLELHGFSDASEQAYGACIYTRSINSSGEVTVQLLCAKSKVAPLKKITLPRLELMGALILSRLSNKVIQSLTLKLTNIFLWSDSTIVLGWIKTPPNLLKTFVANRVSEITSNISSGTWSHVGSKENPADLLTRGVDPSLIQASNLWWNGPEFLGSEDIVWPNQPSQLCKELPELKNNLLSLITIPEIEFPFDRFSSFKRLSRCVAYCLRFIYNSQKLNVQRLVGSLSLKEIENAELCIIKLVQGQAFAQEIHVLRSGKSLPSKSNLLSLCPFLDSGLLRVGGRLKNSAFDEDKKHPIVLPSSHHVTKLIFTDLHIASMHAGPQHLLYLMREKYWPIHGKNTAKAIFRNCITCFKARPTSNNPLMANLPSYRVQPSFPFCYTGVDYAGPFPPKDRRGRGFKGYKGYVCLFICLSTKALHLELVSDLSTPTFISALRRFVSRRGLPSEIHSDNGTNFVGARNELVAVGEFLKNNEGNILDECVNQHISWKFIPGYSPHFGGIWEAGVKSVKFHMKRVLSNSLLVYEDFQTVLVQIEGILNSRPISPLSNDPSDLNPLTPAHFLIGRSLRHLPEKDVTNERMYRLLHYERLQMLQQHFWQRWSLEFISELQQRQKWRRTSDNITTNTMVLIKDRNLPPRRWLLGRIYQLHPGSDGVVRVVSIRTGQGIIRRAVSNICPLPICSESDISD